LQPDNTSPFLPLQFSIDRADFNGRKRLDQEANGSPFIGPDDQSGWQTASTTMLGKRTADNFFHPNRSADRAASIRGDDISGRGSRGIGVAICGRILQAAGY